jgi:hypothetical protein
VGLWSPVITSGNKRNRQTDVEVELEQFTEYQAAFDAILQTARLTANSTL